MSYGGQQAAERLRHIHTPLHVTPRVGQILRLLAEGKSQQQVAFELGIAYSTVKNLLSRAIIENRMGNSLQLVLEADRHGRL